MSHHHSLLASVELSREQEPAVTLRGRDVVVTAGAGAGKTRTLVGRYLSLLDEGVSPRRIAAITFTRKAARETRNRVREQIGDYRQSLAPGSPEARRWEQVQTSLDAARIGTIHELCAQILRTHPAEAAIDPRFQMLEEGSASWLQNEAVTDALAWAVDQPYAYQLFQQVKPARLHKILSSLVANGGLDLSAPLTTEERLARWQGRLQTAHEAAVRSFLDDAAVAGFVSELAACTPRDEDDYLARLRADVLAAFASAPAGGWRSLAILADVKLGRGSQKAWRGGKVEKQLVSGCLKALRERWNEGPGRLPAGCHDGDRALAALQQPLATLVTRARMLYRQRKQTRQALDFDDLEQMALALLRGNEEVRAYWQQQLGAILVDEYQDTNDRQRQLINLLSGGNGNLFIVGDGKQSIYRFRGAEVAVFREEQERILHAGGSAHELATSYRPHARLLAALNEMLPAVMQETVSAGEPWRVPFAPLQHHREAAQFDLAGPFVELELAVGNKDEALPRAAAACAARIERLTARHEGLRYQDVAILCRSSTSFAYYEDALEARGIPYQTIAGRGFYDRPEVRDLLNALQAVLEPAGDLALYGLLRSPVIGYDDADLYRLRRRQLDGEVATLWAVLQEDESAAARRAVRLVSALHRSAGRFDAAAILQRLLEETDYIAALQQAGQERAARNVLKLLADVQQSGLVQLHDFLTYVRDVEQQVRTSEARATVEDAVQIMSIHQAKGLEFPVVVVGDLNHQGGRNRHDFIVDPALGVLFTPGEEDEPAVLTLAKLQEQAQEEAESDRLFYVAATRARDMLLLNGNVGLQKHGPRAQGWLKQLLPALELDRPIEWEPAAGTTFTPPARLPEVVCTLYGDAYQPPPAALPEVQAGPRLPPGWQPGLIHPAERPPTDDREPDRIHFWRVVPPVERPRAPAWMIGTLVHEAIAAWRFPDPQGDPAFDNWTRARARSLGLGDEQRLADASRQVTALLLRLYRHPLYRKLSTVPRLCEVPFSYLDGQRLQTGTIDLLYQDGEGWHLLDFKSDRVDDTHDYANRTRYESQIRRYARAVEQLLGVTPACSICWLNVRGEIVQQPVSYPRQELPRP
jgi:ATP-dependent helicase/nuclease subunit A